MTKTESLPIFDLFNSIIYYKMEIQYIDTEAFRKIMERFNKLVEHIDLAYDKTKGKQLGE